VGHGAGKPVLKTLARPLLASIFAKNLSILGGLLLSAADN